MNRIEFGERRIESGEQGVRMKIATLSSIYHLKMRLLKRLFLLPLSHIWFAAIIMLISLPTAYAHSGMVDSRGGHNCYVGSCAGSYHSHGGSSQDGGTDWLIFLIFIAGVSYVIYRSTTKEKSKNSKKRSPQTAVKVSDVSAKAKKNEQVSFSRCFTRPTRIEIHSSIRTVDWNLRTPAFEKWFIGYLSGFLLYEANSNDPMAILNAGMWSRQAGWERLSRHVGYLIDTLIKHDMVVGDCQISGFKSLLVKPLIEDKNWVLGAQDGSIQAKDWNSVGSILPVIDTRWSELS